MKFANPDRQAFYDELLAKGTEPGFAESLASWRKFGATPAERTLGAGGTERPFHEMVGTGDPLSGVDPRFREYTLSELRRNGIGDLAGKRYVSGLAQFVGDPRAVVGSRSEMAAVIAERGYSSEGLVRARGRETSDPTTADQVYTVADSVVHKMLRDYWRQHPDQAQDAVAHPAQARRIFEDLREFLSGRGSCPLPDWKGPDLQ